SGAKPSWVRTAIRSVTASPIRQDCRRTRNQFQAPDTAGLEGRADGIEVHVHDELGQHMGELTEVAAFGTATAVYTSGAIVGTCCQNVSCQGPPTRVYPPIRVRLGGLS